MNDLILSCSWSFEEYLLDVWPTRVKVILRKISKKIKLIKFKFQICTARTAIMLLWFKFVLIKSDNNPVSHRTVHNLHEKICKDEQETFWSVIKKRMREISKDVAGRKNLNPHLLPLYSSDIVNFTIDQHRKRDRIVKNSMGNFLIA